MVELQSTMSATLLVQHGPEHPTATLARLRAEVEQLQAERDRLASEQVPATDPRLAAMWMDAHEAASDRSVMTEYTTLANHFGIVLPQHQYRANVRVTAWVPLTLAGTSKTDAWVRFLSLEADERREAFAAEGLTLSPLADFTFTANVAEMREQ